MGVLGVIGGSGIYGLPELTAGEKITVGTPFGAPSGPLRRGKVGETEIVFLPRHGDAHQYSPADLPYRANIYALKELGVTHLLGLSAVGSLREELPPRTLILPDQIIDRTVARERTFFDRGVVAHVGIADPYCRQMQSAIGAAAMRAGAGVRRGGSYVCIEGPQFSTRAESELYRAWGATVIGMTAMPEARLAREAELCYATLAMVTDYDVWHDTEADVTVDVVLSHLEANGRAASTILRQLALDGLPERTCPCERALENAIMTRHEAIPAETRERIRLLMS